MNGLDVPVKVTVAGQPPFQLDAGARRSLRLREGTHPVGAETLDGKRRETDQVEVPRSGAAVYSVAGAAPLYVLTAFYSNVRGAEGRSTQEILCGVRTFARDVSYYFADPPEQVTASSSETTVVRSSLLQGQGGWKGCLFMLQASGKERAAAEMLPAVRGMDPSEPILFSEAQLRWSAGEGDDKVLALLRGAIATTNSREAHTHYLRFGHAAGMDEALLREYRQPIDGLADADRRSLLAQLLPAAEAVKELQSLVGERPEDDETRLALAWSLNGAGRFAESLAVLEPLGDGSRLSADHRRRWIRRRVWSLAALGRYEPAIEAIRASGGKEPLHPWLLTLQGLLAAKLGRPDLEPDEKALDAGGPYEREWRQVTYEGVTHPERLDRARIDGLKFMRPLATVMMKAAVDPRLALASLHRATSYEAGLVPEPVAVLLWAEACRTGDAAEPLLRHALLSEAVGFGALCAYVNEGRPAMEMNEAWEYRAAVHVARSRALRARGDAARAAAEEALVRKWDVYGGPATRALESWPSAAPGAPASGDVRLAAAQADAPARPSSGTRPIAPPSPPPAERKLIRMEGVHLEPEP